MIGITDYLTKNQIALTSIAVFAGIGALSSSFQVRWLAGVISFCCLAAMVIIWHELHSRIPSNPDPKLYIFKLVIQWGFYGIALYFFVEFRAFWKFFLSIPLTLLLMYFFAKRIKPILRSSPWLVSRLGIGSNKSLLQKSLTDTLYFILTMGSFILALWLSVPLNILMDALAKIN